MGKWCFRQRSGVHSTVDTWCVLAHLEPRGLCLVAELKEARTTVWAVLSHSIGRDRLQLNVISGHFPWDLSCSRFRD